jgi:hypothetical protein
MVSKPWEEGKYGVFWNDRNIVELETGDDCRTL